MSVRMMIILSWMFAEGEIFSSLIFFFLNKTSKSKKESSLGSFCTDNTSTAFIVIVEGGEADTYKYRNKSSAFKPKQLLLTVCLPDALFCSSGPASSASCRGDG